MTPQTGCRLPSFDQNSNLTPSPDEDSPGTPQCEVTSAHLPGGRTPAASVLTEESFRKLGGDLLLGVAAR